MTPTPAPPRPRPHRRAAAQLLLGFVPLAVAAVALIVVLVFRLSAVQAPLAAATATARATVVASGQPPDGRGVSVTFSDGGTRRAGVIVLPQARQVPAGATVAVQYDPTSPVEHTDVHADGDATHHDVADVEFGLLVIVVVLLVTGALTAFRALRCRRLRRAPATEAVASRVVVRRGLVVRSWLELVTAHGERWLPVYWSPELAALAPGSRVELRGDPGRGRPVLPVLAGAEVWPSGRLRARPPRGERDVVDPDPDTAGGGGWGRQVRSDVVVVVVAPLLGLLWAYLDGSGAGGFAVATVLSAAVLFWLTQLLGSDPSPPPRL